jgi:CheY-like chemotaxis protein
MVYGFVKQSNGYIGIDSPPKGGASISLLLPAVTATLASPEKSEKLGDLSSLADKLLLLVEDNDEVRRVVREQLISLKLQVLEATTAAEARDLIENLPDLDILVSDIRLAGVTEGPKLAEQFYQQRADRTILLISGYTDQLSSDQHREFPLLRKPFDKQALCEALLAAKP